MAHKENMPTTRPLYQGEKPITAKDIAEAIAFKKDPDGFAKALRQVKHWTDKGLLETIGDVGTGKGIAREYVDEPTVLIAATLQELVLFGLTVDAMRPIAKKLYADWGEEPDDVILGAMTSERKSFLRLDFDVDAKGRLKVVGHKTFTVGACDDDDTSAEENMPESGSAIFIRLEKVAERIEWPGVKEFQAELAAMRGERK